MRRLKHHEFWRDERGFTLPEVLITTALLGIVFAIASSSWFGLIESRQVDSATNQMVADLRLAHTSASNRLADHEVRLTADSSTYQTGPSIALQTRILPDDTDANSTVSIVFKPDGSVSATPAPPSGSPITFKIRSADGAPDHDIEINTVTSRVKVVD